MRTTYYLVLLLGLLTACGKEDAAVTQPSRADEPPGSFTASVSNVSPLSALVSWTAAVDPEGGAVRYSLVLGADTLVRKQAITSYSLQGLSENHAYSGAVIAYDAAGHSSPATFSFSTGVHPAPSDFTISQVTGSVRNDVSWTAATLAGEGTVSYDVYLDNQLVSANLTALTYSFRGLAAQTTYAGKIVAKSSYGKSTEKTFTFTTLENQAPAAPVLTVVEYGFRYAYFRFSAAVDPEGEAIRYRVFRDGQDITDNVQGGAVAPGNTLQVWGLAQTTTYTLEVKAIDAAGKEVMSQPARFTTYANPPNPISDLQVTVQGSTFTLSWSKQTEAPFSRVVLMDRYMMDKGWQPVQTSFSGGRYYYTYNLSLLPANSTSPLLIKVEWGNNEHYTYSNEVLVSTYTSFAPTSARIKYVEINTRYRQYSIVFENAVISDYNDWDVVDVVFENYKMNTFVSFLGANPNQGHVSGNVTEAQFNDLKTKSRGWIIISDAGGLHKHEFTYSIVP